MMIVVIAVLLSVFACCGYSSSVSQSSVEIILDNATTTNIVNDQYSLLTNIGPVLTSQLSRNTNINYTGSGLNVGGSSDYIETVLYLDGLLYVGGAFTTAGTATVANAAVYNPATSNWSAGIFGSGANGAFRDMCGNSSTNIWAAGGFTTMNGVTVNRLAKWNGSYWTNVNGGSSVQLERIALAPNGNICIGADAAITISGTNYSTCAEMTLAGAWSSLAANGGITALCYGKTNNNLYVGGNGMTTIGGISVTNFAKRVATTWSAPGRVNNYFRSIEVDTNDWLYIGGTFTAINGINIQRYAKFDGTTWSSLGASNSVGSGGGWDISEDPYTGLIYICGEAITSVGGVAVTNIAVWNGTTISPFPYDVSPNPKAMRQLAFLPDGTIYIGGYTATANNTNLIVKAISSFSSTPLLTFLPQTSAPTGRVYSRYFSITDQKFYKYTNTSTGWVAE